MYIIEINKDIIPYTFNILLAAEWYEFRIDYNNTGNFFTVALSKDGVELCAGEPIVYGVPMFKDLLQRGNFPNVSITPLDESSQNDAVTYDNLSSTVFLTVTGGDYDE